jgi:hypothetical protein
MNEEAGNWYFFELADNVAFGDLLANGAVQQQTGETTAWTVTIDLQSGNTYYWRVKANDCEYTSTFSFGYPGAVSGASAAHPYPNPVNLSSGNPVTFTSLPPFATLTIMTVSGDVVRRWDNLNGDLTWDGTNQNGSQVASGIYIWFVDPTQDNGKLVVVR